MKVMYVASNPEGEDALDIQREITRLVQRLETGVGADPIVFRPYAHLPITDLADAIRRFEPDVLHLSAHGEDGALIFTTARGDAVALDGAGLVGLLRLVPVKPRLVVLNACSSDEMAQALAASGTVDFVIGTDAAIAIADACELAASLYQSLAAGSSIADAFEAAQTMLRLHAGGATAATLRQGAPSAIPGDTRLVDPFRILARLPVVEKWLEYEHTQPQDGFVPENPDIHFGVAGAPAAARQTVFFTDSKSVQPKIGQSLEDARSWIMESQPDDGVIWMESHFGYWGDIQWYAAVTTTDRRVLSATGKTTDALERYYFDEKRWGELPKAIADKIRECIASLKEHGGGPRARKLKTLAAAQKD